MAASEQIADALRSRIESGELAPGDLLPSARRITREWQVAIATATRAHALLRDAGLAETLPGIGLVVKRPTRVRSPGTLRSATVVATAIAIADAEGLDGLSMRRVATELDVAPMSLYRHVTDKDDLLVKMLNAVVAQWRPPERGDGGWRDCLEAAARGLWQVFRRHPWLAGQLSFSHPQALVGGIAWTEWVLKALDGLGLELTVRFDIHLTLFSFVRGTAINLDAEAAAQATTGLDAEEWMDAQLPTLRSLADEVGSPLFAELLHTEYDFSFDRLFERGLRLLLDGLAAELDS